MKGKTIAGIVTGIIISLASGTIGYNAGQNASQKQDPFRNINVGSVREMQNEWGGVRFGEDDEGNLAGLMASNSVINDYFQNKAEDYATQNGGSE